mgnify:CR=1 FL=1
MLFPLLRLCINDKVVYQTCLSDIDSYCHECLALDGADALDVLEVNDLNIVNTCKWLRLKVLTDDADDLLRICLTLLKDHNVLMSACSAKKGIEPNRYIRLAVRSCEDNEKLLRALMSIK